MATSNAPEFPYPGGTPGAEPPDPAAGKPGHFAWSKWIKQYVKNLNTKTMELEDRVKWLENQFIEPNVPGRSSSEDGW